ncbi:FHA domain-containing protein [Synechococcus sp. O70.2]|jgi:pSer/pThr/pTyr-binding forkhead associated (FHA) protein|uniref:FHA domain-containing protein n=1 Tax=unclassified Synechococcus TaxID=2626047 RepID=UPI0039C1229A
MTPSPRQLTLNHLLIVKDRQGPKAYWLTAELYSLGRDPSNSIRIDSQYVSRHHALLVKTESPTSPDGFTYQIIDGDIHGNPSTNGLYVRGERVEFRELEDGDEIQLGSDATATYLRQACDLDRILSTFENTQIVGL